jgi:hypothetical protein
MADEDCSHLNVGMVKLASITRATPLLEGAKFLRGDEHVLKRCMWYRSSTVRLGFTKTEKEFIFATS